MNTSQPHVSLKISATTIPHHEPVHSLPETQTLVPKSNPNSQRPSSREENKELQRRNFPLLAHQWQIMESFWCPERKEYELGRRLHAQMIVIGFALNEYLKTKLLIWYAKAGLL
ncbi:hypothetical protein Droror1_Dr00028014, partial [Drosera rotundifolia]